jgi:glycosyltransferase involved in cell wall biosynthesis
MNRKTPHVGFAYIGALQYRGRLLKQISTLQAHGAHCRLFYGRTGCSAIEQDYRFPIHDVPIYQHMAKWISFVSQLAFCKRVAHRMAATRLDAVVCVGLETLLAGAFARRSGRVGLLVFDNKELSVESFPGHLKRFIWAQLQRWALPACDIVLHAEAHRMQYFQEHYAAPRARHVLIENFPFMQQAAPVRRPGNGVRLVCLGGFSRDRLTLETVKAASGLADSVHLDFVGYGPDAYCREMEEAATNASGRVRILPPVPHAEIPSLLEGYDIGLAFYRNSNLNNYFCASNKVYDYIGSGLPVITNDHPGLRPVLEDNGIGRLISTVDGPSLQSAIDGILQNGYARNITEAIRREYSWEAQVPRYLEVFGMDHRGTDVTLPSG